MMSSQADGRKHLSIFVPLSFICLCLTSLFSIPPSALFSLTVLVSKSQLIGRRLERPAVLARSRCMMDRRVTLLFTQLLGHIVHSLKYYFSNTYAVPIPLEFIYFKKAHHNFPKTQKQFYVCSNHQSQLKDIQWHYCVEKKLKIIVTKIFT